MKKKRKKINFPNKVLAVMSILVFTIWLLVFFTEFDISSSLITGSGITNLTSSTGTTSLFVEANLILDIIDDAINLGALELLENKNSEDVSDWFEIINNGSVNMDVYVYAITSADSPFVSAVAGALPNSYYQVHLNSTGSGSLNPDLNYSYTDVPALAVNKLLLVSGLDTEGGGLDTAKIGINVTIPGDEEAGDRSAELTIYAEES